MPENQTLASNPREVSRILSKKNVKASKSLELGKCEIFEPMKKELATILYTPKKKKDNNLPSITTIREQTIHQSLNTTRKGSESPYQWH